MEPWGQFPLFFILEFRSDVLNTVLLPGTWVFHVVLLCSIQPTFSCLVLLVRLLTPRKPAQACCTVSASSSMSIHLSPHTKCPWSLYSKGALCTVKWCTHQSFLKCFLKHYGVILTLQNVSARRPQETSGVPLFSPPYWPLMCRQPAPDWSFPWWDLSAWPLIMMNLSGGA